jgi:restriction system protein
MDSWTFAKILYTGLAKGLLASWKIWLALGGVIVLKVAFELLEKQRLAKSGITEIDRMDGRTFERYLEALFEKLGYRVELTKYIGDYGADLITFKDGVKTVIQAKRYKRKVDIKAVQEAVAAKGKYGCTEAMVITNSFFTKPAMELAKANEVILWNRDDLVKALLSIKKDQTFIRPLKEGTANQVQPQSQPQPEHNPSAIPSDFCITCGKRVSEKVKQYCLSNQQKFEGKIYCFEHQGIIRNNEKTS